jgi:purine nucleosidase
MRLILDVDTGTDDAGALLAAATHPALELVAAGATWGNCSRDRAVANTLAVLGAAGHRAPVHPGEAAASGPAPVTGGAEAVMGRDGLGDVGVRPPPDAVPHPTPAARAIVELAAAHPGELTLVALAPLTTLAAALACEPALPSLLAGLVVMGGAIAVGGNATPAAEANIGHDPDAAARVIAAFGAPGALVGGRPPVLVPLDATLRAPLTRRELDALARSPLPGASLLHAVWSSVWPTGRLETGRDGVWPCHDLVALWSLIDPGCFTWERLHLAVDRGGDAAWGATVADRRPGCAPVGPGAEGWLVATGIDAERHREGVAAWLGGSRAP